MLAGTRSALGYPMDYKGPVQYRVLGQGVYENAGETAGETTDDQFPSAETLESGDFWGLNKPKQEEQPTPEPARKRLSPIDSMRSRWPKLSNASNDDIVNQLAKWYPNIPKDKLTVYAKSPDGFNAIKAEDRTSRSPIDRLRSRYPDLYGNLDNDAAVRVAYQSYQRTGGNVAFSDFKTRMLRVPGSAAENARGNAFTQVLDSGKAFAAETARQFGPQSQIAALSMWRGARELALTGGGRSVNQALDAVYGPQSLDDRQKLVAQYQGLDSRGQAKLLAEAIAKAGPELQQRLARNGQSSVRLLDQLQTGLMGLTGQQDLQESIAWMTKMVGQIDQDNPGKLPENQEKIAKLIAQAPSQVLVSLFPGVREFGIYSQLYDSNVQAIREANPHMSPKEIDDRARMAADAQFPAQEVLAFMFKNGGGAVTSSITNKFIKAGVDTVLTAGTGGSVFAANQAIQNVAAGKPLTEGVGEQFAHGSILGGVGAVTARVPEVSVKIVQDHMTRTDAGKVVAGYQDHIANAQPADINKFLRGDKDNAIDKATQERAKDVVLSSLEGLKNVPQPVAEEIQKARDATAAGNHEAAAEHAETAFSLLPRDQKRQVHQGVVDTLTNLANTTRDPIESKLKLLGLGDTPTARAIAERALRADKSGKETMLVTAMRAPDGRIITSEFGHDVAAKKIGLPRHEIENGYLTNKGRFVTSPMDLIKQQEAEKTEEVPSSTDQSLKSAHLDNKDNFGYLYPKSESHIVSHYPGGSRPKGPPDYTKPLSPKDEKIARNNLIMTDQEETPENLARARKLHMEAKSEVAQHIKEYGYGAETAKEPPRRTNEQIVAKLLEDQGIEATPENIKAHMEESGIERSRPQQIDQLRSFYDEVIRKSLDCD